MEAVFLCESIAAVVTVTLNQIVAAVTVGVVGFGICIPMSF